MSKIAKIIIAIIVFVVLGQIAKGYNEAHHYEMALEECGSKANVERADSKGFECKSET